MSDREEKRVLDDLLPQLGLVAILVLLNAAFAGSELALVSLREGQLQRLEASGGSGATLAHLARDPNRFLATIQIGITLAGFLASASAAITFAEPVEDVLGFLGGASRPVSVLLVTMLLAYVTLVIGELAPKRIAMQHAERWGLVAARPLSGLSTATRPAVWLLSRSADLAVRLLGGDPSKQREVVTEEEIRDMVAAQVSFTEEQRRIIDGAFEIAERTLTEVLRPRGDVLVVDPSDPSPEVVALLLEKGHSRAPVADNRDLDHTVGVVHLRDLVGADDPVGGHMSEAVYFPESARVLDALRDMQQARQHLVVVANEHGGAEGIVTIEDLLEELVGEIYDEADRDVVSVERLEDGSIILPGRFPAHDLKDVGVEIPDGEYATIAGAVLDALGRIPTEPGERVQLGGWSAEVLEIDGRAISRVRLAPPSRED